MVRHQSFLTMPLHGVSVSFMSQLLNHQGKNPHYPLNVWLSVPQSQTGCCGEENNFLPLPGIEPRSLSCPYHNVLAISPKLTYLHGNQYTLSKCWNNCFQYCRVNYESFAVFWSNSAGFYAQLNHYSWFTHKCRCNTQESNLRNMSQLNSGSAQTDGTWPYVSQRWILKHSEHCPVDGTCCIGTIETVLKLFTHTFQAQMGT